jgi:transcriptional antiterminator RfaH
MEGFTYELLMPITSTVTAHETTRSRADDWYLVQCKPRQDERAEENLARQGYECARPTCRRERLQNGQLQHLEESLFPGYLFIHMPSGANWAPLRSTRGVARVVAFGGRPLAVSYELILNLKSRAESCLISAFSPGEKVTILDQSFAGIESIFMTMDGEERVILLINLMNRQQQISMPLASIASR